MPDDALGPTSAPPAPGRLTQLPHMSKKSPPTPFNLSTEIRQEPCPLPFQKIFMRLPWVPTINHAFGYGQGRVYKSKSYLKFQNAVWQAIYAQKIPRRFLAHPLEITVTQHARNGESDPDNGLKCLLDVLKTAGVIYDDNRNIVKRLTIIDGARSKQPWVSVEIEVHEAGT